MYTNNKWEALSMRDRAFLIREAVRNGITDIDSIRDTWEHRFDGNRDIVDGGEIPAVTITPAKWQKELIEFSKNNPEIRELIDRNVVIPDRGRRSARLAEQLSGIPEHGITHDEYLKHLAGRKSNSEPEKKASQWLPIHYDTTSDLIYKRFLDVYKTASEPTIYQGKGRAWYNPIFNSVHNITSIPKLLGELAHPIEGFNYSTFLKDLPKTLKGELKLTKGYDHYKDPSHFEYRTHKIVEPALFRYILNDESTPYVHEYSGESDQPSEEKPWYIKAASALSEGARMARDARIGAVGAEPIRQLYREGKAEEAQALAKQYAIANMAGAATAAGAAALGTAAGTSGLTPAITHSLQVLGNPALAKTTAGALTAAAADASGVAYGLKDLYDLSNKWSNKEFDWEDIPRATLDMIGTFPSLRTAASGISKLKVPVKKAAPKPSKAQQDANKVLADIDGVMSTYQRRGYPEVAANIRDYQWRGLIRKLPGASEKGAKLLYDNDWYRNLYKSKIIEQLQQRFPGVPVSESLVNQLANYEIAKLITNASEFDAYHIPGPIDPRLPALKGLSDDISKTILTQTDDLIGGLYDLKSLDTRSTLLHEVVHASTKNGNPGATPSTIRDQRSLFQMKVKDGVSPKMTKYLSDNEEQRVRLLRLKAVKDLHDGRKVRAMTEEDFIKKLVEYRNSIPDAIRYLFIDDNILQLLDNFEQDELVKGLKHVLTLATPVGVGAAINSNQESEHKFSGEDDTQQQTYISKKPKNTIKTGNVEFDFGDFDTWRYHNAPTYSKDTDFTLAFTDALLDKEKNFKWGDNYYSTEIDYNKKFTPKNGRKPFEEFADYMYPAVIQVLQENNMPVDMAHNIVRQAAMESDYGLSPRGERGFNLSGIKWTQKAGDAGYKYTTGEDGEKYINFKNLKEYINYKVHTLNNNYNALNASDVQDYVVALHPKAFGKKPRSKNYKGDYSAGAKNYTKSMTGMSSLDKTLMNELYFPLFRK